MSTGKFGYDQSGNLVVASNSDQMKLALMLGACQKIQANGGFKPPAPWTPAALGAALAAHYSYLAGGPFTDALFTIPAVSGGVIGGMKALYGSGINSTQSTPGAQPYLDQQPLGSVVSGLTLDAGGAQSLTPGSSIILDPTVGFAFGGVINTAGDFVFGGNDTDGSLLGSSGNFFVSGGGGEDLSSPAAIAGQGLQLVYVSCDSSGNVTYYSTAEGVDTVIGTLTSSITINQLGIAGGSSLTNMDTSNAYQNWTFVTENLPRLGAGLQLYNFLKSIYGSGL